MIKEILNNKLIQSGVGKVHFICNNRQQFIDFLNVCSGECILFHKNDRNDKVIFIDPLDYFNMRTLLNSPYLFSLNVFTSDRVIIEIVSFLSEDEDVYKKYVDVIDLTKLFREERLNVIL